MKPWAKISFTVACVSFGVLSFLFLSLRNRDIIGEYYAPSSINIEMDARYARNIALAFETSPNPCSYWLSPTTPGDSVNHRVIMHVRVPLKRPYWNPAIQIPAQGDVPADTVLGSIDNVAFFVGNRVFYFSADGVKNFRRQERGGYVLLYIPDISYEKSLVFKNWCNYYGDVNFGIKTLTAFFLFPAWYAPTWAALIALLFLWRDWVLKQWKKFSEKKYVPWIVLGAIIAAGFVLRWNGYTRHSGWTDEIYSAVVAGNPNLPLVSVLQDTGNPPFYFVLLRFWFTLFGWTEESGTMLSVLLGTFSSLSVFLFAGPFLGKKAAILAAFFVAISGFVIGYSQEMRAYILKIFLVPLLSLAFLNYIRRPSVPRLILYLLPALCIVNAHYYGVLLIAANFFFYIGDGIYARQFRRKPFIAFCAGNLLLAASFMPFFLYMVLYKNYNFSRDFSPQIGHTFLFALILCFAVLFFASKKELSSLNSRLHIVRPRNALFLSYIIIAPVLVYVFAYLISFVKPMIAFRYLWPINSPFMFCLASFGVTSLGEQKRVWFLSPLAAAMFAAGLHGIIPDIPSGGTEGYREARAYIASDSAAHRHLRSAMLDNAPHNAAYYGFDALPQYSPGESCDVLYVYNDIFLMHELDMYAAMNAHNIDDANILKIYFETDYPRGDGGVIIKKYLHP
ncbi:MAG: glycosyltransferase family 39 protein [Spirochaetaceae bacterium]|nr:glycosyltransferase family 39 protein [Spirochaetaceae bacterium]